MIIDEYIFVKINSRSYSWYKERGYDFEKCGDIIKVNIDDLQKGSRAIVNAECTKCGIINSICYYNYNKQIKKYPFYVCIQCSKYKSKITNYDKYGCDYVLQNKEIREIGKKTLMRKYGVDNISKLDNIKYDRRDNFKSSSFKVKAKKTWIEKYGVDNPSKSDLIKSKKVKTLNDNYGVDNPMQDEEIFIKAQKSGKKIKKHEIGIYYRGSYEKHFLDFCLENNIKIEKGKSFKYIINDKNRYYHSDFYHKETNTIIEIKSNYYYYKFIDINEAKKDCVINKGYNFILILDKDYDSFINLLNKKREKS